MVALKQFTVLATVLQFSTLVYGGPLLRLKRKHLVINNEVKISEPKMAYNNVEIGPDGDVEFLAAHHLYVRNLFQNDGLYYQTCSDKITFGDSDYAQTVIANSQELENNGGFFYDYRKAHVAPTFRLGRAELFFNRGEMYFGVGGKNRPESSKAEVDVALFADDWFANTGLISISGTSDHSVLVEAGVRRRVFNDRYHFSNEGLICLRQGAWVSMQRITGNGCISLVENAQMMIQDTNSPRAEQTLFMNPQGGTVSLFIDVTGRTREFQISIEGFGRFCFIEFTAPMAEWNFDQESGLLQFGKDFENLTHSIHIGTDFRAEDFQFEHGRVLTTQKRAPELTNSACQCFFIDELDD